ncbi:MAG TPA: SDR family NAD(P)-dependent oxidoreductase [Micropepsaceae bacterium]|jgi:3-oxoacyl-[acyl-carrier protein] reductase|nr:SDR family NAD(P)-dependent oxidoreductase [Micropepsaceae bacterium]
MQELEGSVAIITGAARNIGRAIALDLADAGAAVTVIARSDFAGVKSVAAEIEARGGRALAMQVDVTRADDVRRMVDETLKKFGRIDILVNNAGVRPEGAFEELSLESWHQVLGVILDGPFLCAQAALPALEKSGRGTIINIGGLTAYTGAAHRVHVITAKAGLGGMTKALAVELAPKGITVNLVAPGLIETKRDGAEPVHRKTRTILAPRRGQPEDVSAMVRHLAGPKARAMTGQTIHINGGVYLP